MNNEIILVLVYFFPVPQMFPILSQFIVPFSVSVIFFLSTHRPKEITSTSIYQTVRSKQTDKNLCHNR